MRGAREQIGRVWSASTNLSRRHALGSPRAAAAVIAGLLAAVTLLRWFFDRNGESVALLYVVPIALGALRFGRRGGIIVAGFGVVAFVVLEAVRARGDLDVSGWAGPLLAMTLIGALVGHLSEVAGHREAEQGLRTAQIGALRDAQRSAISTADSMVQQVAAARWMLEAGQPEEALAALGDAVAEGIARLTPAGDPKQDPRP